MYLVGKTVTTIKGIYDIPIKIDPSKICKVKRTSGCKPGEYALFEKAESDTDKFSIFDGYITYDMICEYFEFYRANKGAKSNGI